MLVIVGISTFMVGLSVSKVSVSVWVDMESARTFFYSRSGTCFYLHVI